MKRDDEGLHGMAPKRGVFGVAWNSAGSCGMVPTRGRAPWRQVFLATWRGAKVACKQLKATADNKDQEYLRDLIAELHMWSRLHHVRCAEPLFCASTSASISFSAAGCAARRCRLLRGLR